MNKNIENWTSYMNLRRIHNFTRKNICYVKSFHNVLHDFNEIIIRAWFFSNSFDTKYFRIACYTRRGTKVTSCISNLKEARVPRIKSNISLWNVINLSWKIFYLVYPQNSLNTYYAKMCWNFTNKLNFHIINSPNCKVILFSLSMIYG